MPPRFRPLLAALRISSLSVAVALATWLFATPASADASCPPSLIHLIGQTAFTTTEAVFDTGYTNFYSNTHVAYDLRAGTINLYHCCSLDPTYVRASDLYDVSGVPAGTPVTLNVELVVDSAVWTDGCGGSGCSGTFLARLIHGAVVDERVHAVGLFHGRADFHDVLSVPVTIVAGQPEQVDFYFEGHRNAGGSHGAEGSGWFRFSGLASGVSVISCQGYVGGGPVPVRNSSWGALKVHYR